MPVSATKPRKQQKLFGIALGIKRGKTSPSYSPKANKIAKALSEKKIRQMIEEIESVRKKKKRKA